MDRNRLLEPTLLDPPWNTVHVEDLVEFWPTDAEADRSRWRNVLLAIGRHVGRPGLAAYDQASNSGDVDAIAEWVRNYPQDPLVETAIKQIELLAAVQIALDAEAQPPEVAAPMSDGRTQVAEPVLSQLEDPELYAVVTSELGGTSPLQGRAATYRARWRPQVIDDEELFDERSNKAHLTATALLERPPVRRSLLVGIMAVAVVFAISAVGYLGSNRTSQVEGSPTASSLANRLLLPSGTIASGKGLSETLGTTSEESTAVITPEPGAQKALETLISRQSDVRPGFVQFADAATRSEALELATIVNERFSSLIEGRHVEIVERFEDPAGLRYLARLNNITVGEAQSLCSEVRLLGGECFADLEELEGSELNDAAYEARLFR